MKAIYIIELIPIIFVIISLLLWNTYGKDKKIDPKSNNKLPNLSLPQLSLIYNSNVTKTDLIFLLLDLSNQGYIKIEEEQNNKFKITKLKDIEDNSLESIFLKELFVKHNTISLDEYINALSTKNKDTNKEQTKTLKSNELPKRFSFVSSKLLGLFNKGKNKYYIKESESKRIYLLGMISIILLLVTCYPFYKLDMLKYIPFSLLFSIGTLAVVVNFVNKLDLGYINKYQIIFGTIVLIILWATFLIPVFSLTSEFLISYFIGILSIILILVIYRYMPKKTKLGHKLRTEIESYKKYILKLSKEEQKELLEKEPYYFINILPISYIIGINNTIYDYLKDNKISKPKYYILSSDYTIQKYYNSINRFIDTLNNVK